jgi:predicted transcriptional regulator
MLWRVAFLAERYGRMTMTLDEVAEQIGLAAGTIRNRRTKGEFAWLKADGRSLYADVADVASYLEDRRTAGEETPA